MVAKKDTKMNFLLTSKAVHHRRDRSTADSKVQTKEIIQKKRGAGRDVQHQPKDRRGWFCLHDARRGGIIGKNKGSNP